MGNKAMRENKEGKGRFDLLPSKAITRLAKRFEFGAKKYEAKDHLKGIDNDMLLDSALRHIFQYMDDKNDEDHLAAAVWNLCVLMEQEKRCTDCGSTKRFKFNKVYDVCMCGQQLKINNTGGKNGNDKRTS